MKKQLSEYDRDSELDNPIKEEWNVGSKPQDRYSKSKIITM